MGTDHIYTMVMYICKWTHVLIPRGPGTLLKKGHETKATLNKVLFPVDQSSGFKRADLNSFFYVLLF